MCINKLASRFCLAAKAPKCSLSSAHKSWWSYLWLTNCKFDIEMINFGRVVGYYSVRGYGSNVCCIAYSMQYVLLFLLHETWCSVFHGKGGIWEILFYCLHFLVQSQCCFKKLWKLYLNSFLGTRLMLICIVSDYTGCVILFDRDNEL